MTREELGVKLLVCMRDLGLSRHGRDTVIHLLATTPENIFLGEVERVTTLMTESQTEEEFLRKLETE